MSFEDRVAKIKRAELKAKEERERKHSEQEAQKKAINIEFDNRVNAVQSIIDGKVLSMLKKIGIALMMDPAIYSKSKTNGRGAWVGFDVHLMDRADYLKHTDSGADGHLETEYYHKGIKLVVCESHVEFLDEQFALENRNWLSDLESSILDAFERLEVGYSCRYMDYGYSPFWEKSSRSSNKSDDVNVSDTNSNTNDTIWLILACIFLLVFIWGMVNGYW